MDFWKKAYLALLVAGATVAVEAANTNYYACMETAETNVFLGQVFTVDAIVKAPELPEAPKLGNLPGFNVTQLAAGSATSETNTFLFRYAFRATQEGELTIPPLRFGNLATDALVIHAQKPELSDRMKLDTTLSKPVAYLGEPVVLTTTWDSTYQFGALKAVDFNFPILNDPRFQTLEPHEPEKEKAAQTTGLPVHGTRVLATRSSYQVDAVQHQSLLFKTILIPKKSGKLAIAPSTLLCAAEKEKDAKSKQGQRTAFQYPAYFDNTFFDQNLTGGDYTRIYTESAPIELDVKPLPAEGRPALFNGMVGDYTIAVIAEPAAVREGEPVTLTITVTAAEFVENIFFQPLRYQPLLVNRFEIPAERSLPKLDGKSKIYTQTIRPLSTTISNVPPIQLAFFSPTSNAYVTVQSAPIPLQVSPAEEVAAYGMEGTPYRTRLRAVKEGIRQNYTDPDMLEPRRPPMLGWTYPAVVLPILLLPPLLVGGLWLISLFGKKKHHIHRTAKAARAYKVYRKNAAHIVHRHPTKRAVYSELDQVLRAYLGDRLHSNPGALTFRDVEPRLLLARAKTETIDQLRELFGLCEAYRFTEHFDEQADARKIVHDANRIVKAVEGSLK
ncbi:MAG: BatD family protein [Kiritimatiellales bacterium]|nr:BatD family protein [Kiritimatiellales bacterium]